MPLKKNDRLQLHIDSFGAQGEGVARYDGMPIFIPCALPGEEVTAHILKVEPRYAFAKAVEIMQPSPHRVEPPCPYYGKCGGCVCQHMDQTAQMELKRSQVESCMQHIAGLQTTVLPTLGMEYPWHYRNKISMPVAGTWQQPQIGYYAARSHRVVDVRQCLLASEVSDRVCAAVRQWITDERIPPYQEETHRGLLRHVMTRVNRRGQLMVVLVINGDRLPAADSLRKRLQETAPEMVSLCISVNKKRGNVILGDAWQTLWGTERLEDELCGSRFQLSPLSFFQINPTQTEKLYQTALDFADLHGDETVADLYCGAGTISLLLAQRAKRVIGVEIVPPAIEDARSNAALNGVKNAEFICGAAERVLPELVAAGLRPQVIVLDPPRKGADGAVLAAIADCAPQRVVYVSCNPATLARDAKLLAAQGYRVEKCQPVDMFCQTAGVETVALFLR